MFEIGSSLKEARTRQGLEIETMEARTKVRSKYLRLLEDERFDQLPGPTYTKGFLRVYAESLGLDGQLYVDEFNSRFVVGDEDYAPRTRRVPIERKRRDAHHESRLVVVALAGIAIVTALVIAAWRFGGADTPPVQGLTPKTAEQRTTTPGKTVRVSLRATTGPSYITVREGGDGGAELYAGTLDRGQTQTFVGPSFVLSVSKPARVVVRINGDRYPKRVKQLYVGARAAQ
jgi:cytoskeletal protein RodZ